MKKITLFFSAVLFCSLSAMAQHTFTPVAGPTNVASGAPVSLPINDAVNTAVVPSGIYTNFTVTVDWADGFDAWSNEADLTMSTIAGDVLIDPVSSGGAGNGDATTLTFIGDLAGNYDPDVDGTLSIILNQSWGGSNADWSNIEVTINPPPPPPINDDCGDAIALSCDDVVAFDTTLATLDDAVTCGTTAFSNNVWYTYQGDGMTEEIITLSTCNDADYDTKIFVYEGDCGSLVCVANNDDFTGCAGFSSQLEFVSDGSTVYKISVNGYNLDDGSFVSEGSGNLTITCEPAPVPPANDDCSGVNGAEALDYGVTVTGDNTNATSAVANPTCDPFGVISDVWYSFVAPATLSVDITTTANGSADEAQFAVYDACGGAELGCSTGGLLHVEPLINGNTYFIQVWNDGARARRTEGTFDIVIVEGTLSTTDFDNEIGFTYFPNPVNNNLTLNAQKEIENVVVYNVLGQEVLKITPNAVNTDVNMSELQSGAYFVKVSIIGKTETVKIIKN